jgi:trans-aconitate methyltransferase
LPSRFDDDLWAMVPEEPGNPPTHLVRFVEGLGPAGSALDLGCGDGRLSACLSANRLTLADVSEVALARAARRLPAATAVPL